MDASKELCSRNTVTKVIVVLNPFHLRGRRIHCVNWLLVWLILYLTHLCDILCNAGQSTESSPDALMLSVFRIVLRKAVRRSVQSSAINTLVERNVYKLVLGPNILDGVATRSYSQSLSHLSGSQKCETLRQKLSFHTGASSETMIEVF